MWKPDPWCAECLCVQEINAHLGTFPSPCFPLSLEPCTNHSTCDHGTQGASLRVPTASPIPHQCMVEEWLYIHRIISDFFLCPFEIFRHKWAITYHVCILNSWNGGIWLFFQCNLLSRPWNVSFLCNLRMEPMWEEAVWKLWLWLKLGCNDLDCRCPARHQNHYLHVFLKVICSTFLPQDTSSPVCLLVLLSICE